MSNKDQKSASDHALHRTPWVPLSLPEDGEDFFRASGQPFDSYDPATTELVARVGASTIEDLNEVVALARAVVDRDPTWTRDGRRRSRVLHRFAEALLGAKEDLAELLTREQGKTIAESLVEVEKAAGIVSYYAGMARLVDGRALNLSATADGFVVREPLGVVGVIIPWNTPLILLVRSIAPALAAGNACVVKPSSLTPAVTVRAMSLLASDEELPRGVLGCICGGAGIGEAVVEHRAIDMIAFTGSSQTGSRVMALAASGIKKVCLELGGKSPNIVFADASFEKALAGAREAIFSTAGQNCTAGSRLLLEESIYEEFLAALVRATEAMRVGDGLDPASDMGPLASPRQRDIVLEYISLSSQEGLVLTGGGIVEILGYEDGSFVAPTIVADLPPSSRVIREEIFGPVLAVQRFRDEDEAVDLANATEFGLAAGVWTQSVDRSLRVGRRLEAGTVWINTYHHYYPEAEGGGYKQSGIGRAQGIGGLLEYTQTKHLNFDTGEELW